MWLVWVGFLVRSTGAFLLFLPSSVVVVVWNCVGQGSRGLGLLLLLLQLLQVTPACSITARKQEDGEALRCILPHPIRPSNSTSPSMPVPPSIHPLIHPPPSPVHNSLYPLFQPTKPTQTPPEEPTTQPAPGRLTAIGSRLCKSMVSGTDTTATRLSGPPPAPPFPYLCTLRQT